MKVTAVLCSLALIGLVGCSAKVDGVSDLFPKPGPSTSTKDVTLNVGEAGSSRLTTIQVGSEFKGGGTGTLNFTPDRAGVVALSESGTIAFDCELSTLNPSYLLAVNGQDVSQVELPLELPVQAGLNYTVKVTLPPNTCSAIAMDFFATWKN